MTQSIRFTAQDIGSPVAEVRDIRLRWTGRVSLSWRILLVNLLPVILLAGSLFYIDSIRSRLLAERMAQASSEAQLMATMLSRTDRTQWPSDIARLGHQTGSRIRLIKGNELLFDSWQTNAPNIILTNPENERWDRKAAAILDDTIDAIVRAPAIPRFLSFDAIPKSDVDITLAEDRTHIVTARARLHAAPEITLVTDTNARDVRRLIRSERSALGLIVGITLLASVLLSRFLARTIAQPLGTLALAAEHVRLGRERDINIPQSHRSDEIGALSRALSDMTEALRERIDATEAFAADVAHELKNPLASLSSALETMANVSDPALKAQLMAIATNDVHRLDRLITDIAEASRLDAQLTRTRFEKMDLGQLLERLLAERDARGANNSVRIAFARPQRGSTKIMGDSGRIERMFDNLLDNAISFSPENGVVQVSATASDGLVIASVEDEGPGVSADRRNAIFERFHSDRPDIAAFGRHSGLGLSIARTIVLAHDGTIDVRDRPSGARGAMFVVTLPSAGRAQS
ncbi:MAG: hypothetical protein RLZZ561_1167 [Pseudomonadota bacterium]